MSLSSGRVYPAAGWVPGLFDVMMEDGREFLDVTVGQLRHLQWQGYDLSPGALPRGDAEAVCALLGPRR